MTETLLCALLLVGLPIALASAPKIFNDGDVSWHIATGRWILEHRQIPLADPFSFTAFGYPWVATEWLSDVILATAFNAAGYSGLAALVAAALAALHWIVFAHARRSLGPLGIAATIAAMDAVLGSFLFARPHLLVWPMLAAWTSILLTAMENRRPPPLWSALLMVVWTNAHPSFPLGLLIAGAIALDALIAARWKTWRPWSAFLLAALLGSLLNANGAAGLLQPLKITQLSMLPNIVEWRPSTPAVTPQFYGVVILVAAAVVWRRPSLPLGRTALVGVLLALAFSQVRHQSWLAIVAALILPSLFRSPARLEARMRAYVAAAIPLIALRASLPFTPAENAANPRGLIAAVPPVFRAQPVLNGYSIGGPLILAGIRPYIDGRAEIYGDRFFADYLEITGGNEAHFDEAVARYGIRWTMLPYSDAPLIRRLDASPHWRRIYADRVGVIHVRAE